MSTITPQIDSPATVHPELLDLGKEKTGNRAAKTIGVLVLVLGLLMSALGAFTYATVSDELAAQQITVSQDAEHFAGQPVTGPLTAYAEAQVIGVHTMAATDGQTYAEMDREDPTREVAMDGALLQSSLYTSVIAFGVAALVMGLGGMFMLLGASVLLLARRRRS